MPKELILKNNLLKIFHILTLWSAAFYGCSPNPTKPNERSDIQKSSFSESKGLFGTWVRHNQTGFTLIEIIDSSHVLYYEFLDRDINHSKSNSDRYWYYKSAATVAYVDRSTISIRTSKYRFDYKLKGDTLVEFDKMGNQGIFVKVKTEEDR